MHSPSWGQQLPVGPMVELGMPTFLKDGDKEGLTVQRDGEVSKEMAEWGPDSKVVPLQQRDGVTFNTGLHDGVTVYSCVCLGS